MAANDVIVLDQVLLQRKGDVAPVLSENEFFEIFSAEQILKNYELSYEEIESGITGNGGDGGIDSIYIFVNGELLQEDFDVSNLRQVAIEVIIIQAKNTKHFSETVIQKFIDVSENLLDLSSSVKDYKKTYNNELLEIIQRFRDAYEALATRFPKLKISYFYVTKSPTSATIHHNLGGTAAKLKSKIKQLFSSSECDFKFIGASELLEMARCSPQTVYTLNLTEAPISPNQNNFICLVALSEYSKFINDDSGELRKNIFEANVRDYQGKNLVNDQIQNSLCNPQSEDFWWLNNGVTVLATKASSNGGKSLQIESPEIVNGLQTSAEIHKFFKEKNPSAENRNILVRVVVPEEAGSRDRIIKATNSQTSIPPASLRATEKIHRDIEEFLKPYGFYYDRRKNYYKNEGKPISKIISIPYMAQAVMAIVLQRPNDARGRPSSLLTKDEEYQQLFNQQYSLNIYYFCISLMKRVEKFLKTNDIGANLDKKTRGDIRFYVGMYTALVTIGKINPSVDELAALSAKDIAESILESSTQRVLEIYDAEKKANPFASDKVAKGPGFRKATLDNIASILTI